MTKREHMIPGRKCFETLIPLVLAPIYLIFYKSLNKFPWLSVADKEGSFLLLLKLKMNQSVDDDVLKKVMQSFSAGWLLGGSNPLTQMNMSNHQCKFRVQFKKKKSVHDQVLFYVVKFRGLLDVSRRKQQMFLAGKHDRD